MDTKDQFKVAGLTAAAGAVLAAALLLPLPGHRAQTQASDGFHDAPSRSSRGIQAAWSEDRSVLFRDLEAKIFVLEGENQQLERRLTAANRVRSQLAQRLVARDMARKAMLRKVHTVAAAREDLRQKRELADQKVSELDGQLTNLNTKRDALMADVAVLENQLREFQETQQVVLKRVGDHTLTGITDFEDTVSMTGLDIDTLLPEERYETRGQGGPFIPARLRRERDTIEVIRGSFAELDLQIGRWEQLQALLRSLPLAAPLAQYRITSGFGPREDPVNGRMSAHHGADFAAPLGTTVFSTAPGEVVFAGWKGGFGRLVEIDHGFGVRTLYGHLRKIDVKKGQRVGHRQAIGLVGSSGRSTGAHVHYEVVARREPRDPKNFLEAGMQLFKNAAPSPEASAPTL